MAVRIGNACGFWGDHPDAPHNLVARVHVDYLTLEYLAELTMSILARQRHKDPEAGFATDFLDVLKRLTPALLARPNWKIITNAGGMNPHACARQARALLDAAGLARLRIGVVSGDDLLPQLADCLAHGIPLNHLDSAQPLAPLRDRVVSANAYLGSQPIVEALQGGADLVITGRVADACLTVAPAVFEHGWSWQDWDRLAGAVVAGHLIECGAQVTGGLAFDWPSLPDLAHVGYPIVEIEPDGSCQISKPPGTGGAVNRQTVSEQLLYEVGDPCAYLTPDVAADFTTLTLQETARDVVRISGTRGRPRPDTYKVSIAYRDGFQAAGTLVIAGPDAVAKAQLCGQIILDRLAAAQAAPAHSGIEVLGAGAAVPGVVTTPCDPAEVVLRVAVRDPRREVVERFTRELAPLVTSGPPGVTGYTAGRPPVREVLAYWPALIPRDRVAARVDWL